jgi:glycosyltransferase involved in cell wall biosynthesis
MTDPVFSIILPVYNQADTIDKILHDYPLRLNELTVTWELILIVNGSKDDSYNKAVSLKPEAENIQVHHLKEKGWGRSVQYGLSVSSGYYKCYTNSARTNIDDLILILKYSLINENIIIKANRIIRDSFVRKLGSVIYNFEFRLLFKVPVWDVNGTPKVLPSAILKNIILVENGDLIDAELIAKCFSKGYLFIDIPIIHTKRLGGKSTTTVLSAVKMYFGLLSLKRTLKG